MSQVEESDEAGDLTGYLPEAQVSDTALSPSTAPATHRTDAGAMELLGTSDFVDVDVHAEKAFQGVRYQAAEAALRSVCAVKTPVHGSPEATDDELVVHDHRLRLEFVHWLESDRVLPPPLPHLAYQCPCCEQLGTFITELRKELLAVQRSRQVELDAVHVELQAERSACEDAVAGKQVAESEREEWRERLRRAESAVRTAEITSGHAESEMLRVQHELLEYEVAKDEAKAETISLQQDLLKAEAEVAAKGRQATELGKARKYTEKQHEAAEQYRSELLRRQAKLGQELVHEKRRRQETEDKRREQATKHQEVEELLTFRIKEAERGREEALNKLKRAQVEARRAGVLLAKQGEVLTEEGRLRAALEEERTLRVEYERRNIELLEKLDSRNQAAAPHTSECPSEPQCTRSISFERRPQESSHSATVNQAFIEPCQASNVHRQVQSSQTTIATVKSGPSPQPFPQVPIAAPRPVVALSESNDGAGVDSNSTSSRLMEAIERMREREQERRRLQDDMKACQAQAMALQELFAK